MRTIWQIDYAILLGWVSYGLPLPHKTCELVADTAFCRSTLLCCTCSYQTTLESYFEGKKLSVIALSLT